MSGKKRVLVMPGDGIGPEVTEQAVRVLETAAESAGLQVELDEAPVGGASLDAAGEPVTADALRRAREADAVLLGAVGGPQWDGVDFAKRPEKGLLRLRLELELFANLRPAQVFGDLVAASTLKPEVVDGCDVMVVRELTGGIYFGEPRGVEETAQGRRAYNTMVYSEAEIERIVRMGFEIARKRGKHLTSVDKANVLEVSVLWREVAEHVAADYGDVTLEHMYVDNAAMQLIRAPKQLDTVVTENMFGDILSDAAAMLTGSIGMLPSASLGERHAMYEPVHGSAPDIAGQDMANPLATILSVGMMFRYTFGMPEVDQRIQRAVTRTLAKYRTPDIHAPETARVGCAEMAERVLAAMVQIEHAAG